MADNITGRCDTPRSGRVAVASTAAPAGRYRAEFDTSGSGHWRVDLPSDCTFEDLEALAPVIDEMRGFIEPTVDNAA